VRSFEAIMRRIPAVRIPWLLSALVTVPLFFSVTTAQAQVAPVTSAKLAKAEPKVAPDQTEEDAAKLAQADEAPPDESAALPMVSESAPSATLNDDDSIGDDTQGNAALAAGGIVVGDKGFPLGANLSLSNSFGSGNLLPGAKQQPNWTTSLWMTPTFAVPKLADWQPNMVLAGGFGLTVDLLSAYRPRPLAGPYERQLRLSDSSMSVLFPGLLKEPFTGITITPNLTTIIPTSIFSRHQNRLGGFGGGVQASWSKSLKDVSQSLKFLGSVGAQWRTAMTGWAFSGTSPTLPCEDRIPPSFFGGLMSGGPAGADYPLISPREEEFLGDGSGNCVIPGRQWFASMGNFGNTFWNFSDPTGGNHTFLVSIGISNIALRPLADRPDLRSPNAAPQSFFNTTDFTSGSVQYNYQLPVWDQIQITAGVSSFQPMFDDVGNLYNPWWDPTLGNQFTQGFITVNYNL
jgi:hypothetical protein